MIMVYDWRLLGMVAVKNLYAVYTLNLSEYGSFIVSNIHLSTFCLHVCFSIFHKSVICVTVAYSFSLYWKIWQYFWENHTEMSVCIAFVYLHQRYKYMYVYVTIEHFLKVDAVISVCSKIYPQILYLGAHVINLENRWHLIDICHSKYSTVGKEQQCHMCICV